MGTLYMLERHEKDYLAPEKILSLAKWQKDISIEHHRPHSLVKTDRLLTLR
jgi:hypothetical protein